MEVPLSETWLEAADLGPAYATIQFQVAGNAPFGYLMKDGDTTLLPTGTTVYRIKGYAPTFYLAAERDGQLVLYELLIEPGARQGSDFLDIGGKVREIVVRQPYEGERGRITDPQQVNRLVDLLLQAPVSGATEAPGEHIYVLDFHLQDGTEVSREYNHDANFLASGIPGRGITPPPEFLPEIEKVVAD
jgi:hypothetical protein